MHSKIGYCPQSCSRDGEWIMPRPGNEVRSARASGKFPCSLADPRTCGPPQLVYTIASHWASCDHKGTWPEKKPHIEDGGARRIAEKEGKALITLYLKPQATRLPVMGDLFPNSFSQLSQSFLLHSHRQFKE